MKTADEVRPELIARVEAFLAKGGKLNEGHLLGVAGPGKLEDEGAVCLMGAVVFDTYDPSDTYNTQACRILGLDLQQVMQLEMGFWLERDYDPFRALGFEMKKRFRAHIVPR